MYCHIIRIRNAIKDGNQSSHVDIVHHLSSPCKLIYIELRETMAPRLMNEEKVKEMGFLHCEVEE